MVVAMFDHILCLVLFSTACLSYAATVLNNEELMDALYVLINDYGCGYVWSYFMFGFVFHSLSELCSHSPQ